MKKSNSIFICFTLLFMTTIAYAVESLPTNLLSISSPQGIALLKADLNENTTKLLAHFTTQETATYCGVASAVMVLNSLAIPFPTDQRYTPYQYFTQDNFFNDTTEKNIRMEAGKDGLTLAMLNQLIQRYGVNTKIYFANELTIESFRTILKSALANHQFIIINFLRTGLKQQGGGHHSPIAAYDQSSDRFLILDVARFKYPSFWVKTSDLWKATHTMDGNTYRGFIVISK